MHNNCFKAVICTICLLLALPFTGCSDDDEPNQDLLKGVWKCTNAEEYDIDYIYFIVEDEYCYLTEYNKPTSSDPILKYRGEVCKYTYDKATNTLHMIEIDQETKEELMPFDVKIKELTKDRIQLDFNDGEIWKGKRE